MRHHSAIYLLLATVMALTSCVKSNDTEVTLYNDATIVSFTLGTVNRYLHTVSKSGNDSVYKVTVTGSSYKFHIDQVNHRIYNTDSLPIHSDVRHIVCTIATLNNGLPMFKSLTNDSLIYYATTDSIDFSQPRTVRVAASDGSGYTDWTISVNVHKEWGDDFEWRYLGTNSLLASLTHLRAVYAEGECFVFGTVSDGSTKVFNINEGTNWTEAKSNRSAYGPDVWRNVVYNDAGIYMLDGHELYFADDASLNWKLVSTLPDIQQLVAASTTELFALSTAGCLMVSDDDGKTWKEDLLDDDPYLLPTQQLASISYPLYLAEDTDYVLLAGYRSESLFPNDSNNRVWRKIVDYGPYAPVGEWNYMEHLNTTLYAMPKMEDLSLIYYNDGILALGREFLSDGAMQFNALHSRDNGITWKEDATYQIPEAAALEMHNITAVCDDDFNLWLLCSGTGEIWRGRLNKLAWEYE